MADTPEMPQEPKASAAPTPAPRKRDVYYYDGTSDTFHPVLGLIRVGENRWPNPEAAVKEALDACLESGLLRQG